MGMYLDLDDVCNGHPQAKKELDALRAKLAALSAGNGSGVVIPEPTEAESPAGLRRQGWNAALAWARAHAVAVAAPVRILYPGICDDDIDEMWRTCKATEAPARAMAVEGYRLATEHQKAGTEIVVGSDPVVVGRGELEALRKDREECLGSIDAFLGEASRWVERDGSMFDTDLCEIADRRLRYTLDALRKAAPEGGAA